MRDYGKVHASFWSSDTTGSLPDEAKLLALYLLSCQHATMAGVYRIPFGYITADTNWDAERLRNGFRTLSERDWLEYDEATGWLWIKQWLRWNPPDNPNQWKAVRKLIASVPASVVFKKKIETVSEPLGNLPSPSPSLSLEGGAGETIPLKDGTDFTVPADLVADLKAAYPRLDILAEIRKARAWSSANRDKRKTAGGVPKFLNGWMGRAQKDLPPEKPKQQEGGGRRLLA